MSPAGRRNPRGLRWAIDNGVYSAWVAANYSTEKHEQREHWDGTAFLEMLAWAAEQPLAPRWVVVPDVVGNAPATLREFEEWAPSISAAGFGLALAVQDGMTPADVPAGVVCFLGGTREWKWANVDRFGAECQRLHVGRVNQYRDLWRAHDAGAESCDGSGFFRGDQNQLRGFVAYLKESSGFAERSIQKTLAFPA